MDSSLLLGSRYMSSKPSPWMTPASFNSVVVLLVQKEHFGSDGTFFYNNAPPEVSRSGNEGTYHLIT